MPTRVFVGAAPFSPKAPPEHRGGLYRLSEGADGWDTLTVGLPPSPAVRAVVIHPHDPDVIFAGAQDGPYRSRDGGDTWERLDFPPPGLDVWSFAFHPTEPQTMYLGTGPALLYRSRDGGDSWEQLANARQPARLDMGFPDRLIDLAVDPAQPSTIFAGVEVGGVMRSDDGGETWADCSDPLVALAEARPELRSRIGSDTEVEGMLDTHALAMTAARPGTAYLAVRMGLFRSEDGGRSWDDMAVGHFSPLTYCRDVIVSPTDPSVLYACLSDEAIGKDGSLWRSDDAGESWRRYDKVTCRSTLMQVASHPRDARQVWCATRQGQVFGTLDDGETWLDRPLPTGGRDVYAIACG
jgi:photosystem II stability/assembly factor-like uncharacterized protein